MFFLLPALIYSISFIILFEFFLWLQIELNIDFYARYEIAIFSLFLVAVGLFSIYALRKINQKTGAASLPLVYSVSAFILQYLIDSPVEKQIFIILSGFLFYFFLVSFYRLSQYEKDQTARGLVASFLVAGLFFCYSSFYGIYLNFAIPLFVLMLFYAVITGWPSYQYFLLIEKNKQKVAFISLLLALIAGELAWVVNFWPFGYLTTGAIMIMLFYVFWDLAQSYFLNLLSKRRVLANLFLFAVLIGLVLTTSRWLPAV
jgi:hypothetical protein